MEDRRKLHVSFDDRFEDSFEDRFEDRAIRLNCSSCVRRAALQWTRHLGSLSASLVAAAAAAFVVGLLCASSLEVMDTPAVLLRCVVALALAVAPFSLPPLAAASAHLKNHSLGCALRSSLRSPYPPNGPNILQLSNKKLWRVYGGIPPGAIWAWKGSRVVSSLTMTVCIGPGSGHVVKFCMACV